MNKHIKCPVGIITRCLTPSKFRSIWNTEPTAKGLQLFLLIHSVIERNEDGTVFLNNPKRKNLMSMFRSEIDYDDLIEQLLLSGWLKETDEPNTFEILNLNSISQKLGISDREMVECRFTEKSLTHWSSFKSEYNKMKDARPVSTL